MFGYSTTLRSMSQGRATYTMEFKQYAEAPKNVAEAIINQEITSNGRGDQRANDDTEIQATMARASSSGPSRT
jgi:hypothetical protein